MGISGGYSGDQHGGEDDPQSPAQVGQLDAILSNLLERLDPNGHMSALLRK